MGEDSDQPTPPEGLPETIISDLEELDPESLRKTVVHAQELLQWQEERSPPVEPKPGEDFIRVNKRDGYTEVVKMTPCANGCDDCPHGPYLYHVKEEDRPEGGTHTHWTFIGEVSSE